MISDFNDETAAAAHKRAGVVGRLDCLDRRSATDLLLPVVPVPGCDSALPSAG